MKFQITITLTVDAETAAEAFELGFGAGEHLFETFNDDESITSVDRVEVKRAKGPSPTIKDTP